MRNERTGRTARAFALAGAVLFLSSCAPREPAAAAFEALRQEESALKSLTAELRKLEGVEAVEVVSGEQTGAQRGEQAGKQEGQRLLVIPLKPSPGAGVEALEEAVRSKAIEFFPDAVVRVMIISPPRPRD